MSNKFTELDLLTTIKFLQAGNYPDAYTSIKVEFAPTNSEHIWFDKPEEAAIIVAEVNMSHE